MPSTDYESSQVLDEYLLFHYGDSEQVLPWPEGPRAGLDFPRRCVEETVDWKQLPAGARALDLGCAVGRATFELSKRCAEVIGIDYSRTFIEAAQELARGEVVPYRIKETGAWWESADARAPEGARFERVHFEVGDAHALRDDLGSFDLVLACNLLCRLHKPRDLLRRLPELVKPGGWLVLTTPHTWLEEFTAQSEWLGGRRVGEDPLERMVEELAPEFHLSCRCDLPFLIREHRRKFQWTMAEGSVWHRRGEI